MSPVQYLESIGILGPDVVAAHCIFVDEADRKLLAQRGVGCVHNPFEQHDDRERSFSSTGDALRRRGSRARDRWPRWEQQ